MVRFLNIFRGDVILTTWCLNNHMSSLVLDNKIPHSILFSHEPLHSLPLKFFGSICFVHYFDLGLDKLSPRSYSWILIPNSYKMMENLFEILRVTRLNISFAVSVLSQFLNFLCQDHYNVCICILKDLLEKVSYMVPITIQELFAI